MIRWWMVVISMIWLTMQAGPVVGIIGPLVLWGLKY